MNSTNKEIALFAMVSGCGTGSNALPLFMKGLTNAFPTVRSEAAYFIGVEFGAKFPYERKPAIPLLLKLLNDPDQDVRASACNALKDIDPQVAAKAGIN